MRRGQIEIYAGDTPLYDAEATTSQQDREREAADRLFPLMPDDQAAQLRVLWDEFEQRWTPEARFAKAMDRFQPFLLNWMAGGGTWRSPGVARKVPTWRRWLLDVGTPEATRQLRFCCRQP